MWEAVIVRRDKSGMFNFAERPLAEHLADELNKMERKNNARVTGHIFVTNEDDLLEIVVKLEPIDTQTNNQTPTYDN